MLSATCSRCQRKISILHRDPTCDLCPRCRAADASAQAKAQQEALLAGLRALENSVFWVLLSPLPKAWVPRIERGLTHPRIRGLMKLVGGLLVGAVTFLLTWGVGMLTGYTVASALVGLPITVSLLGLMEIVLGIEFADFASRFDEGGFFVKLGLLFVLFLFVGIYLAGGIWVYRTYYQY